MRLHWLRTLIQAMPRTSVTFRPSPAAAKWLDRQRQERHIPLTTLCQMALDEHMQRHEARAMAEVELARRGLEIAAFDARPAQKSTGPNATP